MHLNVCEFFPQKEETLLKPMNGFFWLWLLWLSVPALKGQIVSAKIICPPLRFRLN